MVKIYLTAKHFEGCSDNTIENYLNILRVFFETVRVSPQDVQTNTIRMFLMQYQAQKKVTNITLDKYRQVINSFFEWCVNEEYMTKNPCKNIHEIKHEIKQHHALTRRQFEIVRRKCKSKRDLAIVDVLFSTGCRVNELVNMKISDINTSDYSIHIIGKGNKHNTVYLNDTAQLSLEDYMVNERQGNSDYIFVSERKPHGKLTPRAIQMMFNNMGLTFKVYPHKIRHTTATIALKNGMPITQIQKMLGHSSVATTQRYAETSQDEVAIAHSKYVI